MSKGRLITALILAALICAGCGGNPKSAEAPDERTQDEWAQAMIKREAA